MPRVNVWDNPDQMDGKPAFPERLEIVVEIPRGSRNKYEFDKQRGVVVLDRVLYSSVHYPTDYGFISGTLALDGDALDALVVVDEPTFPGCHVMARPIGVLDMRDEKGPDNKILAVPIGDPRFLIVTRPTSACRKRRFSSLRLKGKASST